MVLERLERHHERLVFIPARRHDVAVETRDSVRAGQSPTDYNSGHSRSAGIAPRLGQWTGGSPLSSASRPLAFAARSDAGRRAANFGRHVIHDDVEVVAPMRSAPPPGPFDTLEFLGVLSSRPRSQGQHDGPRRTQHQQTVADSNEANVAWVQNRIAGETTP